MQLKSGIDPVVCVNLLHSTHTADCNRKSILVGMYESFRHFSHRISEDVGSPWAFICAFFLIFAWAVSGPFFNFSENWQLVINTATTILTFLMVFLIQNMQNRDAKAIHLKLDELIRASIPARDSLIDIEDMRDDELEALHEEFTKFREVKIEEIKRKRRS